MSSESVWFVKLPSEFKEIFEKKAEEQGDLERGAAARQVRKFLKEHLNEEEGSA